MTQNLPPGQTPIDPKGAFTSSPPPGFAPPGFAPPGYGPPQHPSMWQGQGGFPPPRPPRRHIWLWLFCALLVIGLLISLIVNGVLIAGSASSAVATERQTLVPGSSNIVAVVPVDGLIDDSCAQNFAKVLDDVSHDSNVRALVVTIDTPGGSASSADEMYHRLDLFSKHAKSNGTFPVVIAMRGMATSGGYYLACAGDYIFAEPGCLTGNIGVLLPRVNLSKLAEKYGIDEATLTATVSGHSYKNAGSMLKPPDPRDEAYLQGLIDGIFTQFKSVVMTGRKGKLHDDAGDIFSGKAFIASDAKIRGLIDEIGYPEKAFQYAASTAGVSDSSVVQFEPKRSLIQLLTQTTFNQPPAKSEFDASAAMPVRVDANLLRFLVSPEPLMLWRGN